MPRRFVWLCQRLDQSLKAVYGSYNAATYDLVHKEGYRLSSNMDLMAGRTQWFRNDKDRVTLQKMPIVALPPGFKGKIRSR